MQAEAKTFEITLSGKKIPARPEITILQAVWEAGLAEQVAVGCAGGVCGACTVTVRFPDGRPGGTDLACLRMVEEGMEVFPCPVDSIPAHPPVTSPDVEQLKSAYPTLTRCTKCGSCTTACPMSIPVMDSVLQMQSGQFESVSEAFTSCIHCGLCRFVCEDKVKPHNMALWVRRSLGKDDGQSLPASREAEDEDQIWEWLMTGSAETRLERARAFRKEGKIS